jgi:cytochrome P450
VHSPIVGYSLTADFGFGPRSAAFRSLLGEGIFTQEGITWKHSRELLRRQFVRMQYQNLEAFREHVDNLVNALHASSGLVDLQPFFLRFTLDTTTALIFGQSVSSLKFEGRDSFSDSFNEAAMITAMRARLGDLYWAYTPSRFSEACRAIKSYVDDYIKEALKRLQQDSDDQKQAASARFAFINELYDELTDPVLVRDQLVNVLLAGRDTTACLMSWTFRLLVRYPAVLARLREEVEVVLEDEQNVTRAHIRGMPYLQCVLNETLRLYPPVPINLRFATRTTFLPRGGGPDGCSPVLLRRGMGITYSVYHMHRRKDLYGEDATSFRPERWEQSQLADIKMGYLPFNTGPRVCLGKDLALMEASYGIVRVIQAFPSIRLSPNQPREEPDGERQALTLVLASADGCKVLLQ